MATATTKKVNPAAIAEKFRKLADGMQNTIDANRAPMTQNPTPKRMKEYMSRKSDGDNLERGQRALRALADAWERDEVPACLRELRSKGEIVPLVRHGLGSNGYYDLHDTGRYADTSEPARVLQQLMEGAKSEADKHADAERARLARIEQLENDLRFCDIPGFFPTPRPLISLMVQHAALQNGLTVLEPSAGKGDIADFLRDEFPNTALTVDCCEIRPALREILEVKGHRLVGSDCLQFKDVLYDRVLMNPPFERGQDIDHVRHAYSLLAPGGRLVAIISGGSYYRSDKKSTEFREWLAFEGASVFDVPADSFKGAKAFRQTGVNCKLVVLSMPAF